MTRTQFLETVDNFYDLVSWCDAEGCNVCEELVYYEDLDDVINGQIESYMRRHSWYDLKDELDGVREIVDGDYYWYCVDPDEYFSIRGLTDDDFIEYKGACLDFGDMNESFDNDEEEEMYGDGISDDVDVIVDGDLDDIYSEEYNKRDFHPTATARYFGEKYEDEGEDFWGFSVVGDKDIKVEKVHLK